MKITSWKQVLHAALIAVLTCSLPAVAGPDTFGLGTGRDGALVVASDGLVINRYAQVTAPLEQGASAIPVASGVGYAAGDLVLVLQMTGQVPAALAGEAGPMDLASESVGRWELARLASVAGAQLELRVPLSHSYSEGVTQVIRVPEFTTVTIPLGRSLVPAPWNGSTGGVVAFLATGTVANRGSIHATGMGFRGGTPVGLAHLTGGSGEGGAALSCSLLEHLVMGGGAGDSSERTGQPGGVGGGIIFIRAHELSGAGAIVADGAPGGTPGSTSGVSGGGAGGSISLSVAGGSASHAGAAGCGQPGGNGHVTSVLDAFLVLPAPVLVNPPNFSSTNNTTPTYSGTVATPLPAGTEVVVFVDGSEVGRVTPNGDGTWVLTPAVPLLAGVHDAYAVAVNVGQGEQSPPSNTNTFDVDVFPPQAPILTDPSDGTVINTSTPTFAGTAEPNSTVTVYVDGIAVGTTTADDVGNFSFTPTVPLTEGVHQAYVTSGDAAGNTSPDSNISTFTVDGPPAAPVVVTPADGSVTSDTTPTYSGTAEAGSTVTVIVDGTPVGTTTAGAGGNWSFTQVAALADGAHTVRATARDAGGNTSPSSNTNTFIVDTVAPAAPVVVTPADGSVTSDTTPTYSGTAEAGSTVTVVVDGTPVGTATADGAGNWSFTPGTALADGPHTVRATATDAGGNTSPDSNTNAFTVDTVAPAAPVVNTPADGSTTSDNTPTYSGTAEAGSTVTVIVDGTPVGTTTADVGGNWSFTPVTALADGPHTVRATATDAAGNTSPDSNTNAFTVDTVAPAAPVVNTPADGSTTSDNTPTYSGTAEAGSTVTVIVDGTPVGTTTADVGGNWSFTPVTALADGPHTVRATATDAAGNASLSSNTNAFIVDTVAPAAPVVVTPADGSTTSDNTPTYSGTAEAGSTVTVIVDGTPVGTTTADGAGNWSFTPTTGLASGSHTVRATATDAVGNTSPSSNTNTFTVDATFPAAPVVVTPADGSTTSDNTPTYSGTAEAGSTVTVIVDGTPVGTTTADGVGNWSFTPGTALAEGPHTVRATATDAGGNTSPDSNTNAFIVDTVAPAAPVVNTPADGAVTSDTTPTYSGTAEAGSTVTVIVDGTPVGTTTADGGGNWSFTPVTALADGPHTVRATATDVAGNASLSSNTNAFIVDTVAPAAPVVVTPVDGSTTSDNTPTYSGTAEAGSTVTVIVDGTPVGTTTADGAGNWSFTPTTGLASGSHTVRATATDGTGNTSPSSNTNTFTVDATLPAAPVVVTPAHNSTTRDTTPEITGTSEPNVTVTVLLDGTPLGTTTADGSGNWTLTPGTALAPGTYDVSAVARNASGNTSPSSNTHRFTIDTTAPSTPGVSSPTEDSVTNDSTPPFTGTAEPGSTVTVILDGNVIGTTIADAAGNWSFTPITALPDGPHTLTVTATDAAGNTSAPSSQVDFIVDTALPDTSIVSGPSGDTEQTNAAFDFGSNESDVSYECRLDGAAFAPCSDPSTFANLAEGTHSLEVRARDRAGNVDATPASASWTVRSAVPGPTNRAFLGDGVGCAASGGAPSSLAMMGLAVLSALLTRRRRG